MVLRNSLLRAYVAEHIQLLLVVSAHRFFLPALPVKVRFFLFLTQLLHCALRYKVCDVYLHC